MEGTDFRSEDLPELWPVIRPQDRNGDVRKLPLVTYAELMVPTWDRPYGSIFDLVLDLTFGAEVRN